MTLEEMIAELPRLSDEERWQLIERAMEIQDFSEEELKVIDERIAEHDRDRGSSIPMEEMVAELSKEHFSVEELKVIGGRLADDERNSGSWMSLDELKAKLREKGRL